MMRVLNVVEVVLMCGNKKGSQTGTGVCLASGNRIEALEGTMSAWVGQHGVLQAEPGFEGV